MHKVIIIITGGNIEDEYAAKVLQEHPKAVFIGVDRGIEYFYKNQMTPDYIVGDFDSVDREVLSFFQEQTSINIREFQPEKDASDTEIAVRMAIELGATAILLLGATGSRLDHMWANVQVLSIPHKIGIAASILDPVHRIRLVDKTFKMKKTEAKGSYFSVFSLGKAVEGLTIKGAKYPLVTYKLEPFDSLSVSNEIVDEVLEIEYREGQLVLMEIDENN